MDYERPDHFTRRAKAEGFAARSVYKLDEIADRSRVVPTEGSALDLGCYPGSWSRWLILRGLRVVGVDLLVPDLAGGTFLGQSVYDVDEATLIDALGGPTGFVCSDMAPSTTGNRFADHCRQIELADRALELAAKCLRPGGGFVVKVFDGADAPAYTARVRQQFTEVRRVKPDATRGRSVEFFLVGLGFRGATGSIPGSRST